MQIRYLPNKKIDRTAWDTCIREAVNGRIYAYSWYLDQTASHWDALVAGNYEAVFPLPWNAKLGGIKQIYHPYFSQQLGLFYKEAPFGELLPDFLDAIPKKFRFITLALNEANKPNSAHWHIQEKTNYLLDLDKSVEEIRAGYSKSLRKRVRKAAESLQFISDAKDLENFVGRYHQHLKSTFELNSQAYKEARQLLNLIHKKEQGTLFRVDDPTGKSLGEIFLPRSHNRLYYLMGYATLEGKQQNSTHFLLDQIFQYYAQQDLIFDFEGSSIPNIASFFASFGAEKVSYPAIQLDRLPRALSWLKDR
ncbi:MAG: hypothetical protein KDC34_12510 [Saprospiraceae bacterium]|nr:hypothetical protein [Saprospiraceae bacterium]